MSLQEVALRVRVGLNLRGVASRVLGSRLTSCGFPNSRPFATTSWWVYTNDVARGCPPRVPVHEWGLHTTGWAVALDLVWIAVECFLMDYKDDWPWLLREGWDKLHVRPIIFLVTQAIQG